MPHEDPVNWQPIHQMPLIARMIDDALDDTRKHLDTLAEARVRPHAALLHGPLDGAAGRADIGRSPHRLIPGCPPCRSS